MAVNNSTFISNSAHDGGAVYNASKLTMTGDTFLSNKATHWGGALINDSYYGGNPTATVINSNFQFNQAVDGGAVWSDALLTLTGDTIQHNQASHDGGGVFAKLGTLSLSGNTITDNTPNDVVQVV